VAPSDFVSRGQALVASGQYQEAVKICRLGLLGRPTAVEGRVVLGQALLALRRYDEVLAEMRVALELENTSAAAYQLKGEALLRKGDAVAAIETLTRAKQLAPGDPSIAALLAEAEIAREGSAPGVGGLGYVDLGDSMTKHYPSHQGDEASGQSGSYTRPTSLQKPTAGSGAGPIPGKGSPTDFADELETRGARPGMTGRTPGPGPGAGPAPGTPERRDATPPPHVLSVGDRSGTVEVDPEVDGVELDDDIGELAEPPVAAADVPPPRGKAVARPGPTKKGPGMPGTKRKPPAPSRPPPGPGAGHFLPAPSGQPAPTPHAAAKKTPTLSLDDEDVIEVESGISLIETPAPIDLAEIDRQARMRAQRRSAGVGVPAGPLPDNGRPPPRVSPAQLDAANRPTAIGDAVPPNLRPPTMAPPQPGPGMIGVQNAPRPQHPAAMPTVAGMAPPPPGGMPGALPPPPRPMAAGSPAAALPTMALSPAAQRSAAAVDSLFPDDQVAVGQPMPSWAKATMVAPGVQGGVPPPRGPMAPPGAQTARPQPAVDPSAIGEFTGLLVDPGVGGVPPGGGFPPAAPREDTGSAKHHPTGVRKPRRFRIAMWSALAVLVIGGGVFAGFQIRRIRLERQIDSATSAADNAAKPDTWLGWIKARDGYAGIVNARDTASTRAKVARAKAVLAADFGDDVPGAKQAVDALAGGGGPDGALARAYLAIAVGDAAAAQTAAAAALEKAPDDPAAHAVVGRAAILGHRWADAVKSLKIAVDKDARPAYLSALAEAYLGRRSYDDARTHCERSLAMVNDHPQTLIVRARVLAASGKLASGALGADISGQLERVLAEGQRAFADQTVGVSPRQAIDAAFALVAVQLARNDAQGARAAFDRATATRPADQRFEEDVLRAFLQLGQYTQAKAEAKSTLEKFPGSIAARIGMAEALLVEGDGAAALETLAQAGPLDGEPEALALRGKAYLAMNDLAKAKADLDAALSIASDLETAVIGRTWVDLRTGDTAHALQLIEPLYMLRPGDALIGSAYAAAVRRNGKVEEAREVLRKITEGPDGPGVPLAWLELGRLERDAGDYDAARKAYGKAIAGRSRDAKLEAARLYIDTSDVKGGRDTLEDLVKQWPEDGEILVETARARTLQGDLGGARELLDRAEKLPTAPGGLERERGRLYLKDSDFVKAVTSFDKAISADDRDIDAHLLLLDAMLAQSMQKQATELLEPAKKKFGDRPERFLIMGKVALITGKAAEAKGYFDEAKKQLAEKKAPPRRSAEALFGLALCALAGDDLATAAQNFKAGLEKDPVSVDALAVLGQIYEGDGNNKKALENYEKAATYNPAYADMAWSAGRVAAALGKAAVAREWLEKYLALAPGGANAEEAKRLLTRL
jgi:tetratricopeptide (TPR) repeat protein